MTWTLLIYVVQKLCGFNKHWWWKRLWVRHIFLAWECDCWHLKKNECCRFIRYRFGKRCEVSESICWVMFEGMPDSWGISLWVCLMGFYKLFYILLLVEMWKMWLAGVFRCFNCKQPISKHVLSNAIFGMFHNISRYLYSSCTILLWCFRCLTVNLCFFWRGGREVLTPNNKVLSGEWSESICQIRLQGLQKW